MDAREPEAVDDTPAVIYEPPAVDGRTSARDPLVWTGGSNGCCPI